MYIPINMKHKSRVLIAGAGGGFDFLCGLPMASSLIQFGHEVVFANYSFTNLTNVTGEQIDENLTKITYKSEIQGDTYFPEGFLAKWYKDVKNTNMPVYCYKNIGITSLISCYNKIQKLHNIDTIFVIDGGVDGIFRGDEYELGTPSMDSISMIAANECSIPNKLYVMTAFGSEGVANEVSHAEVLLRISDLIRNDGYYGVSSLLRTDFSAKDLISASKYIFSKMPEHQHSNIVCSILKSLDGSFGFTEVNLKTVINPIWVSALTSMYWFFDLNKTARLKLFYNEVMKSSSVLEVSQSIEQVRCKDNAERMNIPI